jgi:hypothetical protein
MIAPAEWSCSAAIAVTRRHKLLTETQLDITSVFPTVEFSNAACLKYCGDNNTNAI